MAISPIDITDSYLIFSRLPLFFSISHGLFGILSVEYPHSQREREVERVHRTLSEHSLYCLFHYKVFCPYKNAPYEKTKQGFDIVLCSTMCLSVHTNHPCARCAVFEPLSRSVPPFFHSPGPFFRHALYIILIYTQTKIHGP